MSKGRQTNFMWSLFAKGLDVLLVFLGMRAAQTETKVDDYLVELFENIGDKFIPGETTKDGLAWAELPALSIGDKSRVVKTVGAVIIKELLLMPEFRKEAKLDDIQADRLLIAALTFLKPEAVDTPEEVQAILDTVKPEVVINE